MFWQANSVNHRHRRFRTCIRVLSRVGPVVVLLPPSLSSTCAFSGPFSLVHGVVACPLHLTEPVKRSNSGGVYDSAKISGEVRGTGCRISPSGGLVATKLQLATSRCRIILCASMVALLPVLTRIYAFADVQLYSRVPCSSRINEAWLPNAHGNSLHGYATPAMMAMEAQRVKYAFRS